MTIPISIKVRRFASVLLVVAITLAACSSENAPTAPTAPVDVSGTWTRTACAEIVGCKVTMAITQSGSLLSGTYIRDGLSGVGSLTGTVTSQSVSANLK